MDERCRWMKDVDGWRTGSVVRRLDASQGQRLVEPRMRCQKGDISL